MGNDQAEDREGRRTGSPDWEGPPLEATNQQSTGGEEGPQKQVVLRDRGAQGWEGGLSVWAGAAELSAPPVWAGGETQGEVLLGWLLYSEGDRK